MKGHGREIGLPVIKYFMNRWLGITLIFMVSAIGLANKQSPLRQSYANNIADTTISGEWFLQPALPSDTAVGKIPVLRFDLVKKTFSGNNGCNSMNGHFMIQGNQLEFNKNITTTKMLCTGYNEKAFMENLLRTNGYKIENGLLILMTDGTQLSKWTREVKKSSKVLKI